MILTNHHISYITRFEASNVMARKKVENYFNANVITLMVLHDFHTNHKHFILTLVSCSIALVSGKSGGEVVSLPFYKREREKNERTCERRLGHECYHWQIPSLFSMDYYFCYTYGGYYYHYYFLLINYISR